MNTDSVTSALQIESIPLRSNIVQLNLSGTLDWTNYVKVDETLQKLFAANTYRIVINLRNINMITTAGFGSFIGALEKALKHEGNLVFVRVPQNIQNVFQILGLSRILTFAATEEEALSKFSAPTA